MHASERLEILTNWDSADIYYALRKKGTNVAQIAKNLGAARSMVYHVICGKRRSTRIADAVATAIEKTPQELWPDHYPQP